MEKQKKKEMPDEFKQNYPKSVFKAVDNENYFDFVCHNI